MEIWLEPSDLEYIANAAKMGLLYGVSTNPSIVARSDETVDEFLHQLLEIQNGPVAVQVTASKAHKMIQQGRSLHRFSHRVFVKIPVTAEGLVAISALQKEAIPTVATAVFETQQALLAARAGAQYIAPYYAKICEEEMEGQEIVRAMLRLVAHYKYPSKLLALSFSTPEQVKECCEMGIDAVGLNKQVFHRFIEDHPLTVKSMKRFASDWKEAKPSQLFSC